MFIFNIIISNSKILENKYNRRGWSLKKFHTLLVRFKFFIGIRMRICLYKRENEGMESISKESMPSFKCPFATYSN